MLDRADCADFGCHNSIRLETKHFLNTLALTFISFSGRFVFAMQKHYLFFFASDPLVLFVAVEVSTGVFAIFVRPAFTRFWCSVSTLKLFYSLFLHFIYLLLQFLVNLVYTLGNILRISSKFVLSLIWSRGFRMSDCLWRYSFP